MMASALVVSATDIAVRVDNQSTHYCICLDVAIICILPHADSKK